MILKSYAWFLLVFTIVPIFSWYSMQFHPEGEHHWLWDHPHLLLIIFVWGASLVLTLKSFSPEKLGITISKSFSLESITWHLTLTLLGVLGLYTIKEFSGGNIHPDWWDEYPKFWLPFISALLQELIYRSYLVNFLVHKKVSLISIYLISGLSFAWLHFFSSNLAVVLPITLIAGLGYTFLFLKFRNIYLITFSHALLNFLALYWCVLYVSEKAC